MGSQVAAALVENGTHIAYGPQMVIGQAVNDHPDSMRQHSLKGELLEIRAVFVGFIDGTLDGIFWHVHATGILHSRAQPRIGIHIGPSHAGSHCNLLDQFGE